MKTYVGDSWLYRKRISIDGALEREKSLRLTFMVRKFMRPSKTLRGKASEAERPDPELLGYDDDDDDECSGSKRPDPNFVAGRLMPNFYPGIHRIRKIFDTHAVELEDAINLRRALPWEVASGSDSFHKCPLEKRISTSQNVCT